jgi:hypothetical protein
MRALFRPDPSEIAANSPPLYPDDIEGAIQDTLAILADIDCAFDERRSAVWMSSGPQTEKLALLNQIDMLHRQERERHVKRLADLYGRIQSLTLFRNRH